MGIKHSWTMDHMKLRHSSSAVQSKSLFSVYCLWHLNHFHNEISQLYCYKPRSKHGAIMVKSVYFRSQNISFTYNTPIKNNPQCATHFNLVQLCHICINREALNIVLAHIYQFLVHFFAILCKAIIITKKYAE